MSKLVTIGDYREAITDLYNKLEGTEDSHERVWIYKQIQSLQDLQWELMEKQAKQKATLSIQEVDAEIRKMCTPKTQTGAMARFLFEMNKTPQERFDDYLARGEINFSWLAFIAAQLSETRMRSIYDQREKKVYPIDTKDFDLLEKRISEQIKKDWRRVQSLIARPKFSLDEPFFIQKCGEYPDGCVEEFTPDCEHEYVDIFWTLFVRNEEGFAQAVFNSKDEAGAVEMHQLLMGRIMTEAQKALALLKEAEHE
jgi:hypothetical protein